MNHLAVLNNCRDIFLVGQLCCGKDYIGNLLQNTAETHRILKFAGALKQMVAQKHGITIEQLDSNKEKYRDEMQKLGSDMRKRDPLFWIKKWQEERSTISGQVVCTDCRHVNEVRFARLNMRGFVLKIETPINVRMERALELYGGVTDEQLNHESEKEVERVPYHAIIAGTLPDSDILETVAILYNNWVSAGFPISKSYLGTA